MSLLDELSDQIDWVNIEKLLFQAPSLSKQVSTVWHQEQIEAIASMFKILLWAPREYLPRASRSNLLRRAVIADYIIIISSNRSAASNETCRRASTIIRMWLSTMVGSDLRDFLVCPNVNSRTLHHNLAKIVARRRQLRCLC